VKGAQAFDDNIHQEAVMRQNTWALVCGVMMAAVLSGVVTAAQARRAPAAPEIWHTAMKVSLTAGGQRYESSAAGKCTHAPAASVAGVASELWTAEQSDNGKSLRLTLWQPKDGTRSMVSLTVTSGSSSHRVSTVRGAATAGNAKASFEQSGKGGTFTVYAKSAEGADIIGTITCDDFSPHVAEGGL
jgi:hypothetical protein